MAANPWDSGSDSAPGLKFGDPSRVLALAWKHNLQDATSYQVPSDDSVNLY